VSDAAPISFIFTVQGDQEFISKMDRARGGLQNLGKQGDIVNQQVAPMERNFGQAALGLTTAASGAASLYFQYDNLQKSALKVETAQKNVTSAEASLAGARNALNELTAKGAEGTPEYEAASLRLKAAQEQLEIATQKVTIAQGDNSEAQLRFGLGVVPTIMGSVDGLSRGLKGLGLSTVFAGEGAMKGSHGMKAMAVATKGLFVAMGPLGWTMLGVSAFMGLFATNTFGIRDAIYSAGKAIGDTIPILRPLLDMLGNLAKAIFPETEMQATEMGQGLTAQFDMIKYGSQDMGLGVTSQLGLMESQMAATADSIVADAKRINSAFNVVGGGGLSDSISASVTRGRSNESRGRGAEWDALWNDSPRRQAGRAHITNEIKVNIDGKEVGRATVKNSLGLT
jgi:hypothetical protein